MLQGAPTEETHLEALREAGRLWHDGQAAVRAAQSGSIADLVIRSERPGGRPGDRYVRFERVARGEFKPAGPGAVRATAAVPRAQGPLGRLLYAVKQLVVGDPLANERSVHERLTKVKALAVLSSDAISSVAYATGAMLAVLLLAGTGSFDVSLGIGAAIALLFATVILSYRQTVKAYPKGGGSYIVASDNLGHLAGLIAGASLMIDYILTVAVSITQGVANLVSLAPGLAPYALALDLACVALLLCGNLRGIRESGTIFMLPSYLFIMFVYLMIVIGGVRFFAHGAHVLPPHYLPGVTPVHATETLSLFLILRAFAGGCTALTGIEAISDGVPAFKPPEWRNARATLTTLGVLAVTMFVGITLLVHAYGLVPNAGDNAPTLISLLNVTTLGHGIGFYYGQLVTALILLLAANTAFSDFPRLAFFMARDGFLPHQFTQRGDRLSYSNGILILTALATLLIVRYWSDTSQLFNLYVIGVFASFTLSQSGMVRRWWSRREAGWRRGMAISGFGATVTFVVLCITAVTKFTSGAWLVVVLVPIMVTGFFRIHAHYRYSAAALRPRPIAPPTCLRHLVLVSGFGSAAAVDAACVFAATLRPASVCLVLPPGDAASARARPAWPGGISVETAARAGERAALLQAIGAAGPAAAGTTVTVLLPAPRAGWWGIARRWWLHRTLLRRGRVAVAQIAPGLDEAVVRQRHTALVTVARLNLAALDALAYARSLVSGRIVGIHVSTEEDNQRVRREWDAWGNHLPLVTIDSPYRAIVGPLRAYVDALARRDAGETIILVLPLVFAPGLLSRVLHNHTAHRLRRLLLRRPNTVVISVPRHLP